MKKSTKTHIHYSPSSGQGMNLGTPIYEIGVLYSRPWESTANSQILLYEQRKTIKYNFVLWFRLKKQGLSEKTEFIWLWIGS
jgi:hypothetical protein